MQNFRVVIVFRCLLTFVKKWKFHHSLIVFGRSHNDPLSYREEQIENLKSEAPWDCSFSKLFSISKKVPCNLCSSLWLLSIPRVTKAQTLAWNSECSSCIFKTEKSACQNISCQEILGRNSSFLSGHGQSLRKIDCFPKRKRETGVYSFSHLALRSCKPLCVHN